MPGLFGLFSDAMTYSYSFSFFISLSTIFDGVGVVCIELDRLVVGISPAKN
jgi:hypothetical protein